VTTGPATTACGTCPCCRPCPAYVQGTIKSPVAFGALLADGISDATRVSLSAPPVEAVKVGMQIRESLGLRQRRLKIVSCPSCGHAQVDVYTLANRIAAALDGFVAREADLGAASGNGKGQIFVRGEIVKSVPESQIVEALVDEAVRLAESRCAKGRSRA
jgi:(E)-4-hydroxy-3-methylbut-2-enyl-diphosphate synthase